MSDTNELTVTPAFLEKINFDTEMNLSKEEVRELLAKIEEFMKTCPQVEIPLKHYFSNGVYAREITIPKGALIVGKIHKFQNMTSISKGEVSVLSIDGQVRLQAGDTIVSSPGVKRLIYAHEETKWTTFHATKETDIEKIEKELIADDYSDVVENEIIEVEVKPCLS